MRVLLTGGAGFIGSHVSDMLIDKGHEVIIIDNLSSGKKENLSQNSLFYEGDIRGPIVKEVMEKERPVALIHHAAQISVRDSVDDPIYDMDVNIGGTLNLLQNSVRFGIKRFLFACTGGALYGEQDYFPADEEHPIRPISPYGIAKLSCEKYLYFYHEVYGLSYVSLRYSNVYGPRQDPYGEAGVVAIFSQKMLAGEQPVINGSGEQTRDFVFVEDVARANILALETNISGVFNIGTGIETTVNELFKGIKGLFKSNANEVHGEPNKGEQLRSVIECSKAKRELGWHPNVPFHEGLKQTAAFFEEQK
ncbi:MAG: GDP-mannose 4,6-dehydratase [Thermodesulfobacteriota bacterium]|nr:GDP-mannose 4,6-dehydratase [Thermodesulfobacteriota bacterium]